MRTRIKNAFLKKSHVQDSQEIEKAIQKGEYVLKELEALVFLRKYRSMKSRYYDENVNKKSKDS